MSEVIKYYICSHNNRECLLNTCTGLPEKCDARVQIAFKPEDAKYYICSHNRLECSIRHCSYIGHPITCGARIGVVVKPVHECMEPLNECTIPQNEGDDVFKPVKWPTWPTEADLNRDKIIKKELDTIYAEVTCIMARIRKLRKMFRNV